MRDRDARRALTSTPSKRDQTRPFCQTSRLDARLGFDFCFTGFGPTCYFLAASLPSAAARRVFQRPAVDWLNKQRHEGQLSQTVR